MAFTQIYTVAVDRTKCGSSNLTNFPVRIFASNSSLKSTAHGGDVTSSSGFDIVILADDGTLSTLLPWEVDTWDPVNGVLNIWAQIPSVNGSGAGANSTFIVAWGDSSITTQQNVGSFAPSAVWDSNYKMVLHFGDGTTLNLNDSTANGNNAGNPFGDLAALSGPIGGGVFVGPSGGVRVPASGNLADGPTGAEVCTFSCWFYENLSGGLKYAMVVAADTPTNHGYILGANNGGIVGGLAGNLINGPGFATIFHYVVGSYDGTQQRLYVDGVEASGSPNTQVANADVGFLWAGIGLNGGVDEARLFTGIARSGDWAFTEFKNQSAPGNIGSPDFLIWNSGATLSTGKQPRMFVMT